MMGCNPCKSDESKPPQPDPRMYEVMSQQTNLSQQALDFYKQAYAENQPRQQALDQMNLRIGESLLSDAEKARQRGDEAYQYYQQNYRPVEGQMIRDAQTIDSESNIAGARGRALADVQQQTGMAQQANMRTMSRFGLRPNATRMAAINSQLAGMSAAAGAGAMQNAEQAQKDRGMAMRANVANIGRGYPATTLAYGQAATGGSQAALGGNMATNAANLQNQSFAGQGYGLAGNLNAQALQGWGNIYGTQMQGYGIQNSSNASNMAGFGSLAGLLGGAAIAKWGADGGKITGPGTGTSDSILAKNTSTGENIAVSNGEYVIPADVVRTKGTEFFDKLLEKHHVPAAMQRRAAITR